MNERRRFERFAIILTVEVSHPQPGICLLNARDLSDSGVILELGDNPRRPEIGTQVSLRLTRLGDGELPPAS